MLDQLKRIRRRAADALSSGPPDRQASLSPLHGAAAQLLLATGAGAALEHLLDPEPSGAAPFRGRVPPPLAWAPALIGPLAAAAHLAHARAPSDRSETAADFLNASAVTVGAALFFLDLSSSRDGSRPRMAPLAFAAAGLVGLVVARQEREIRSVERDLRRRADVVERLVPQRRPKLDRIVLHL